MSMTLSLPQSFQSPLSNLSNTAYSPTSSLGSPLSFSQRSNGLGALSPFAGTGGLSPQRLNFGGGSQKWSTSTPAFQSAFTSYGYAPKYEEKSPFSKETSATLQVGSFSTQGTKPNEPHRSNEDAHFELNLPDGKLLVGVFDGHGLNGHVISNRVKSLFAERAHVLASAHDVRGAFQQAFDQIYNQIRNEQMGESSGTTATVALVDSVAQRVSIAHVGDSTAIVIDPRGNILFTSQDHRPCEVNFAEAQRLRARGAEVNNGRVILKTASTIESLALSRSMGDFKYAQQGVTGQPDVAAALMFQAGSSLLIASDGVWDVVRSDEAMRMIMQSPPQNAAQQIVNVAHSNWTKHTHIDDITAVLVKSVPADMPAVPSALMGA